MKKEKKFKAKRGQVDFTNIRWAPVINCVLKYKNKVLLVKRSEGLRLYPGCWNGVSGFLDDNKSLEEKIWEELREEVGLDKKNIISYKLGQIFIQEEEKYNKTWIVHPVLVTIDTDQILLDWEAQKHVWIKPSEIKNYKLLPGVDKVFKSLFS